MDYNDLVFNPISNGSDGTIYQAIIRFENDLGLSVLCGPRTLTSSDHPYEAAVISFSPDGTYTIIYPDFTHNDVLSFLTAEQLSDYMIKVSAGTHIAALKA